MQAEILELERKFEVAGGKKQDHFHEQLEKLKWGQESLQEELSRMKEEGTPSTPKPAMPSPLTTVRQKEPAIPAGSGMPRTSPWVVLKDLLPQGVPKALSNTKNPSSEGEADIPSMQQGDPE